MTKKVDRMLRLSREYDFGSDCMEASIFRGQPK